MIASSVEVRGTRLQLAGTIARCSAKVAGLVERLPDLAPVPELSIIESPAVLGTVPYIGDVILLEPQWGNRICAGEPTSTAVVLHELAHAWCPGSTPDDNLTAARLCESIANYVAASVATSAELAYLLAPPDHPVLAVGIAQRVAVPERDDRFVSYQKGMLILRAIERRIGVEQMRAALRDFFKRWRDQTVTWEELARSIEIVAGADAATDARKRFADPAWPDPW